MSWRVAGRSDRGHVRRANEDTWGHEELVLVVVDGMGGQVGGALAAKLTHEQLIRSGEPEARFAAANEAILAGAREQPSLAGMGSVAVRAELGDGLVRIAHVGDCRAYLAGATGVAQLTEDHTVRAEHLREQALSESQAQSAPGGNEVTRDLGGRSRLEIDLGEHEVEDGDLLLLCSDGLTDLVPNSVLYRLLTQAHGEAWPLTRLADALVEEALARGGTDNVTVAVARCRFETRPAESAPGLDLLSLFTAALVLSRGLFSLLETS